MENKIRELLDTIKHPEKGIGIHDGGFIEQVAGSPERVSITLRFEKKQDPFALKIKRRVEQVLDENRLDLGLAEDATILVIVKEGVAPRKIEDKMKKNTATSAVKNIVAVASGKGGVGKSSVTANLALALRDMGYTVGVLDADIYGPSQNKMFGVEGFLPEAYVAENGEERIIPAEALGVKIMSIGFFIKADDPLLWRGQMASNALKQLLHQTEWGELDFLLIDLPPGTGDIHLCILGEVDFSGAVIVSTPQGVALADVVRGVEMFNHSKVGVPLLGMVENMAYFSPDDMPGKKYYIFGQGGASKYAAENGVPLLGEVPIYEAIMQGGEDGKPAAGADARVAKHYKEIAQGVLCSLENLKE